MNAPSVLIDVVDPARRIVQAHTTDEDGQRHRLGHLPGEGWFCVTCRNTRCPQIHAIRALVIDMETP